MQKYILSFIFILCLTNAAIAAGGVLQGLGTEASPYLIEDYEDLKVVNDDLTAYYRLAGDIDAFASKAENGGDGFIPIGSQLTPFKGIFDGNGYRVFNLNIKRPFEDYIGLFAYTNNESLIFDLGVIGSIEGRRYVGAIVGYNYKGNLQDVYTHGSVKGEHAIGGVIGSNNGETDCSEGKVWKAYSSAFVKSTDSTTGSAGGIIGAVALSCLLDSYSTGIIKGKVDLLYNNPGKSHIGGLIGSGYATTIKNSFFNGVVITNDERWSPGGYLESGSFENCYSNSDVNWKHDNPYGPVQCIGLTSNEMIVVDSFGGFNFDDIWENYSGTYPLLQDFKNGPVGMPDVSDTIPDITDFKQFVVNDYNPSTGTITEAQFTGKSMMNEAHDVINLFYRPGVLSGSSDTIWGGVTYVAIPYDTIPISSYEDLKRIGNGYLYPINGVYKLTRDIDASASLLENGGEGFRPLASVEKPFSGVINGSGFEISNLHINTTEKIMGLFKVIGENGQINDLRLNVHILSWGQIGGLAGINYGLIQRVIVSGLIDGDMMTGGIVGENKGGIITQSVNYAKINGDLYTGGIAGRSTGQIIECYNNGEVDGNEAVGGVVGGVSVDITFEDTLKGLVTNCYNTGRIVGDESVGGVVGSNSGTVNYSYALGKVEGRAELGGVVGLNWDIVEHVHWARDLTGQRFSSGSGNSQGGLSSDFKFMHHFTDWNFHSIWRMSDGVTFPALRNVVNAPVAMPDSIQVYGKTRINQMVENDIDIQAFSDISIFKIDTLLGDGNSDYEQWYMFNGARAIDDRDTLIYRSGIIVGSDTIWSNRANIILINQLNTKPEANDNTYSLNEDDTLVVAINDLLLDDVDVDPNSIIEFDSLITTIIQSNMLSIEDDSIVFVPTENWNGTLRIPYVITDGALQDTADLVFTVNAVNDPTTFTDVSPKQIDEDDQIVFDPSLSNALNVDGDNLEYIIESDSNYIVNGMTVIPDDNYYGLLVIPVKVYDGDDTTASVKWMVTVDAINDSPVMTQIDTQTIDEDASLSITLSMTDAQDVDGDSLEVILVSGADYDIEGTIVKPRSNFFGDITVGVKVTDGIDTTGAVPLAITVEPINDVPVITNVLPDTIVEDTRFGIADLGITSTDVEGESVTTVVKNGLDYVVIGDSIVPASNFNGELAVSVQVEDGTDSSAVFSMALTVSSVDDPTIFTTLFSQIINEDSSLIFDISMSDAHDVDDALTAIIQSGVNYTVNGFEIIPDQNYYGQLAVPISYTNGRDTTTTLTLAITVEPVNDIPVVLFPQQQKIKEDATIDLLVSMVTIMDPDGSDFQLIINSGDNYTFDGTVVYPVANYNGILQVPIQVTDGVDTSSTEIITVEVQPVNDVPVILSADTVRVQQGELIVIDNSGIQMVDAEGDLLSVILGTGEFYDISGSEIVPEDRYVGDLAVSIRVTDGVSISEFFNVPVVISPLSVGGDELLSSAHSIVSSGSTVNSGGSSSQSDTTLIAVPEVIPEDTVSAPIHNSGNLLFEASKVSVFNMLENTTRTRLAPINTTYFVLYNLRGQFISEGEIREGTFTIPSDVKANVVIVKFYKGYLK